LGSGYGYIRLTSFIENSAAEVEKAIKQQIKNSPDKKIRGIILDLRRNPGGLLDQAIKISDLFLEQGIIVSTMGRKASEKEVVYAKKEGTYSDFPIIVLINEYSASASEIVAGALQDNKRALIMGQTSFGKGSVQSVVKLGDGSALKLTVARYYTPSGKSIQSEGIKPDVVIEEVDSEAYKKAIIKREVRKESDMSGHLLGTKEQEKVKEASKESNAGGPTMLRVPEEESVNSWWKKDTSKQKLSTKEKLLSEDFQVLQAYNYLKAWKVMANFASGNSPTVMDKKAQ
jgi:carboxyl-terminal processing protease